MSRTCLILVRTDETARALPPPYQSKAIVHQEIGTPTQQRATPIMERKPGETLKVLFAGRLLSLKGIHLALRAIASARSSGTDLRFTIIGSGPKGCWLKQMSKQLGLDGSVVQWVERVPQEQLFKLYEEAHCLLFPSLHDSSGNVVLEAISFGLPVICLDLGGPKTLVNEHCATVVNTTNRSEDEVINALAQALIELASNETKRLEMSQAAIERAIYMAWDKRIKEAMALINAQCFALRPN